MTMPTPSIEYGAVLPLLIVLGAAVAGVLVEAFAPRRVRLRSQLVLTLGALAAAAVAVGVGMSRVRADGGQSVLLGALAIDGPALMLQGTVVIIALLAVALMAGLDAFTPQGAATVNSAAEKVAIRAGVAQTEIFPLTLFAAGGMLVFVAADDLLTMFVALEVLSLPLYLLCGLARRNRTLSHEAALKYFLLGAFSSAFFLFGVALLYGYAGTLALPGIGAADGPLPLGITGFALLAVGLLFKVGAVPFHSWVPDVYQGAPTPVTAFMAAATKVAAFGALARICFVAVPGLRDQWTPALWLVAVATMVVGTVAAVTVLDIKRMLAYSAIAHTGFLLAGVISLTGTGISGILFYLFAYGFSTVGAFAIVSAVRGADGSEATALADWAGLGRAHPVLGLVFALLLLAFAGIPLTSGFVAKFVVFSAAAQAGYPGLVVVGVLASAVAAAFYVRVIVLMFFTEPPAISPTVRPPRATTVVVAVCAVVTFLLGALPQPLLDLADAAGGFLG